MEQFKSEGFASRLITLGRNEWRLPVNNPEHEREINQMATAKHRQIKTPTFRVLSPLIVVCCGTISWADQREESGSSATKVDHQQMLVEPQQLFKELRDANLRILDARSMTDYARGHIPGAVHVAVGNWKNAAFANRGLHNAKVWRAKIGPLGISADTRVVVYGSNLTDTARIWWLLKYVGVHNTAILNGGWQWWIKNNRPRQTSIPEIVPVSFKLDFQKNRLAQIESVKQSLQAEQITIVDTRSSPEFNGGRIPTATHLEWKELLAADGRLKTKRRLRELFKNRGIVPEAAAVCY